MSEKVFVRDAIYQALDEEMTRDQKIFIVGEEVEQYGGAYKVTRDLHKKHNNNGKYGINGKRVIDTPITEHGFAGIAAGAAFSGLIPVVEFMTFNFAMQAIDHIINSSAKTLYMSGGLLKSHIVFRGPNGAAARVAAQHPQCYASWYAHVPGLKVIAPYFAADYKGLLKSALRDGNPIIFLENEICYGHEHEVPSEYYSGDYTVEIGKANVVRSGSDVTLVTFSIMVQKSLEAAEILAGRGISVEVIDLRTIRPLDINTIIDSVKKTNRLICVEEGWTFCGVTSEISALVCEQAFDYLDHQILRVGSKDVPLPYAANLEAHVLPSVQDIVDSVMSMISSK